MDNTWASEGIHLADYFETKISRNCRLAGRAVHLDRRLSARQCWQYSGEEDGHGRDSDEYVDQTVSPDTSPSKGKLEGNTRDDGDGEQDNQQMQDEGAEDGDHTDWEQANEDQDDQEDGDKEQNDGEQDEEKSEEGSEDEEQELQYPCAALAFLLETTLSVPPKRRGRTQSMFGPREGQSGDEEEWQPARRTQSMGAKMRPSCESPAPPPSKICEKQGLMKDRDLL